VPEEISPAPGRKPAASAAPGQEPGPTAPEQAALAVPEQRPEAVPEQKLGEAPVAWAAPVDHLHRRRS
jgi:hypothetical protein